MQAARRFGGRRPDNRPITVRIPPYPITSFTSPVNANGVAGLHMDAMEAALHDPRNRGPSRRTLHQIISFGVPATRTTNQATQTPIPIHTVSWEEETGELAGQVADRMDRLEELLDRVELEGARRYGEEVRKREDEEREKARKARKELAKEGNDEVKGKENGRVQEEEREKKEKATSELLVGGAGKVVNEVEKEEGTEEKELMGEKDKKRKMD